MSEAALSLRRAGRSSHFNQRHQFAIRDTRGQAMRHFERLQKDIARLKEKLSQANGEIRQLKKSLRKAEGLLDDIPVAVGMVQDGKFVFVNSAVEEGLGLELDRLLGRSFLDFVHPSCVDRIKGIHHKRSMGKVAPDRYETEIVTGDNGVVPCEVFVRKTLYEGRRAFLLCVVELGERRSRENQQEQACRVEGAVELARLFEREWGAYLRALLQRVGVVLAPEGEKDASQEPSGFRQRGMELLRQIERLSRLRSTEVETNTLALKEIVQEAVETAKAHFVGLSGLDNAAQPRLKTHLRAHPYVEGNSLELKEAFAAVIGNALEAAGTSGEVHVSTEISLGSACVYVQDSGPGMGETARKRIFDPFYTTKGARRFGLGLTLAFGVVRRYGGDMEFISRPGGGTQVVTRLPLAPPPKVCRNRGCGTALRNRRILVWSHDSMLKDLISKVLEEKACRVTGADEMSVGLKALGKGRYDLVILDLESIAADPLLILSKVRKSGAESFVTVVKTKGAQPGQKRLKEYGADLIVFKPVHVDGMLAAIAQSYGEKTAE